jgi:DNA-binding response OmpR family regulator
MIERKVLIVDDEEMMLDLVARILAKSQIQSRGVTTAEEAVKVLETERYPLMLFDLRLPGMSGIDLCRHVRQRDPISVIFAMTGYASMFELSEVREVGFDDYFLKPLNALELQTAILDGFIKLDRWRRRG